MSFLRRAARRFDWYPAIGTLLFLGSLVPSLHNHGTQFGGMPPRPFDAAAVVAIALQCFPLALGRRWPAACLALVAVGFAVDQLRGYHSFAGTALAIALLNAGFRLQWRRRPVALVCSAAYLLLVAAFDLLGAGESAAEYASFYLALVFAWGIGAWLRSTRRAEAERRRRVTEETRVAERTRIARELHDVVTHHVTAMVVQAEAARYLTTRPDRLDQSLTAVTGTGRHALSELRNLLDLLDPGQDDFHALAERTRLAGQPVEFREEGDPAESAGNAGPVAYRVVQEALTNALKHARGNPTSVRVRHGKKEITVEVRTDGTGAPAGPPGSSGGGRGLAGLRERVGVLGGEFSAGRADGGFQVRARIPS